MSTYKWKWLYVSMFSCAPSLLILKAFSLWKISTRSLEWCKQPNLSNPHFLDYSYHPLRLPSALVNLHTHINELFFFADDPPVITWAHNAGGGVRAQLYHKPYMELVGTAKIWFIFEDISKLWPRMKVFVSIESVFTSSLSNEGAWWDLTCQTLSPVPLSFIENNRQLMVAGGFYNYST